MSYERGTLVIVPKEDPNEVRVVIREYRGTWLIRNRLLPGPTSRCVPKTIWWPWGWRAFPPQKFIFR